VISEQEARLLLNTRYKEGAPAQVAATTEQSELLHEDRNMCGREQPSTA
jgi:hypothetical protein